MRVTPDDRAALWSLSWPTLAVSLSGQIALQSDNIVVGAFLGPASVTAFFLTQRLARLALAQLEGLGIATWAPLVELHAQEKHDPFRQRLLDLTSLLSGVGLATLGPIVVYNQPFMRLWVGPGYFAGYAVCVTASINAWLWSLSTLWSWPISGTGRVRHWLPYAVTSAVLNISISVFATIRLGVVGPLLGTLAAFVLVQSWALPRVLWELFSIEPRQLLGRAAVPLLWGGPYLGILWFAVQRHPPDRWVSLGLGAAGSMAGGAALWWFLSLTATDRSFWTSRLRILLRS
ncbi:MAG: hypothetical protein DMF80_12625 [Acidobacteria bacterium]|nr:MAG: hypothetical protein DMF80_12625 [Acidobacteriota bacterium]